ncbi:MAG: hypothetical protein K0R18_845 [Bacillales bacterium]|jgi:hypothetical protein|nr:hypothetical protein [Bacillales bacterium]
MECREKTKKIERPKFIGFHPIELSEYIIDTLPIVKLKTQIDRWIREKIAGAIVHGGPRMGKTYFIKFFIRLFNLDEGPEYVVFTFSCRERNIPNENNFFSYLLKDLGHELHEVGNAVQKRNRVVKLLLQAGLESSRKQVVLFIDDAQILDEKEYKWLMDIFNELDRYDVKLTTILFGQNVLFSKRSSYTSGERRQIYGRFMIQEFLFTGINNKESLEYFLSGYDDVTEYPKGSGWSYTRYYFPVGFDCGERLAHSINDIWRVLEEIHMKQRKKTPIEVPMTYMTTIINDLFLRFGSDGENLEWINIDHWREVLLDSAYYSYVGAT